MQPINIKVEEDINKMKEGGRRLGLVKNKLKEAIRPGVSAMEIENLAVKLIESQRARPSFKMVKGYRWATCININDGLVHGIPKQETIFKKGDVVSVDVGAFYEGFHTDTSFSVEIEGSPDVKKFLGAGEAALEAAIESAQPGRRIYDISAAIETSLLK